jgi:hypothetical protein
MPGVVVKQGRRGLTMIAAVGVLASLAVAAPACTELRSIGTFSAPVDVVAPLHEDHLLFVVERAGRIRVVRDGTVLAQPFLDISGSVGTTGEAGLLSLAFPPRYWQTGRFVVFYVDRAGVIQIAEFRRSAGNPEVADALSERTILTIPHPTYSNHYGGSLAFGPDGLLYAGTGDGGGTGDPLGNAQDLDSLLGKVLRIDPFGAEPYAIPPGNPFVGQAGTRPEIFAYGLRNPWRLEFDRATGDLVIGDVGQGQREEVDYVPAPLTGGLNFGWNAYEGSLVYSGAPAPGAVFPVLEYPHTGGACSITGGVVVRDPALTELEGRYLYGDWCTGAVRFARLGLPVATDDADTELDVPWLVSFGEDAGGCVYAVSLTGPVYRFAVKSVPAPVPCPDAPPETTITSSTPAPGSASFAFSASEAGSTFECRVDTGPWTTCSSPAAYAVAPGVHVLQVRATDPGGTVDPTPAQTQVTVGA